MLKGKTALLDSTVMIDHVNNVAPASELLWTLYREGAARVSPVTRAEVLSGCDPAVEASVARILDHFPFLPACERVADAAARLRRRYRWSLPDALQAATARVHGLVLVTRNTRDFPPDLHDFVIVPYSL